MSAKAEGVVDVLEERVQHEDAVHHPIHVTADEGTNTLSSTQATNVEQCVGQVGTCRDAGRDQVVDPQHLQGVLTGRTGPSRHARLGIVDALQVLPRLGPNGRIYPTAVDKISQGISCCFCLHRDLTTLGGMSQLWIEDVGDVFKRTVGVGIPFGQLLHDRLINDRRGGGGFLNDVGWDLVVPGQLHLEAHLTPRTSHVGDCQVHPAGLVDCRDQCCQSL